MIRKALNDELGHALILWLYGHGVADRHRADASGAPIGDCYKCRRVRDFLRGVVLGNEPDPPDPEVSARVTAFLADHPTVEAP